ncbi:MAG: class I SAM-dependent methyltransferase [Chloroflexi bacterium]|nr:class I SAM-dependent methyltransferase [Chloroflexota bacterium]
MKTSTEVPDFGAIKGRQRATWASGDYHVIAAIIVPVAERLCDSVDLRAGQRVLDIATGSGNAAIAAARRLCAVTGIDYVPELLQRGRLRAEAEGLPVQYQLGDAEMLPADDASFDVALSTFGVMFAPDQERTARELLRVIRSGGRIGLANWTPEGWIGEMLRVVGRYLPPPPGVAPSTRWGTEEGVRQLLGGATTSLQARREFFVWHFTSADQYIHLFRNYYGPTVKAFGALEASGRKALTEELLAAVATYATVADGTLLVPAEYLEVVATRA